MLDPSRQIVDGYAADGLSPRPMGRGVLSGIVKGESDNELTLVDALEGLRGTSSASPEIEKSMSDHSSLMPDGLAAGLSQRDFADLIAYLDGLPRTPDRARPAAVWPDRSPCHPGFSS